MEQFPRQGMKNIYNLMNCGWPDDKRRRINIVYVIESATYRVGGLYSRVVCVKTRTRRYEQVRAFDTNNE